MTRTTLLDERSRPDFGDHYLRLLAQAEHVGVAASRIRLAGLQLDPLALASPGSLQVLLMELSGLALATEADRLAEDPRARRRLAALVELLDARRLEIRSSPLGGWAPDFSVFQSRAGAHEALVGPHWLDRPYPHRGPALTSLHTGAEALRIRSRFHELWEEGHGVGDAVRSVLASALSRCATVRG